MSAYSSAAFADAAGRLLGILFVTFGRRAFLRRSCGALIPALRPADTGGHLADFGVRPTIFGARTGRCRRRTPSDPKYTAARQGLVPIPSRAENTVFASTAGAGADSLLLSVWNFSRFDFGKSYFRERQRAQLMKEKLPVSVSLVS